MTLQKQLFFISLSVLILPWAGCQFVKEMDNTLREGQVTSLKAQARAIATTLENSETSLEILSRYDAKKIPTTILSNDSLNSANSTETSDSFRKAIYFPLLSQQMIIDGYLGDWNISEYQQFFYLPQQNNSLNQTDSSEKFFNLQTGIFKDTAYLSLVVSDNTHEFYNPQRLGIANGDHVILHTKDRFFRNVDYILQNSGSGRFIGYYLNANNTIRPENAIKGFWRETKNGYIIETQLPLFLLNDYLTISYIDQSNKKFYDLDAITPQKIILYSSPLETMLKPYVDPGMTMHIIDNQQWLLASVNNTVETRTYNDSTFWLIQWLYKIILDKEHLPDINTENTTNRFLMDDLLENSKDNGENKNNIANTDEQFSAWYRNNSEAVARVASPFINPHFSSDYNFGYVILEQNASAVSAATHAAFNRLFLITLSAISCVTILLLAYASFLSYRIRRLRNATDSAINQDGKINADFIHSSAKDEIGELTRSYKHLLERLDDYTDYLRTLASKLSHELRTPLAVIKSSLDNLEPTQSSQQKQYLRRASEGADRLSHILNAMSAANRLEESIRDTQSTQFALDELLTELVAAYQSTYTNRRIVLTIDHSNHSAFSLYGSPDLIVQMLDKLVDNAVDFCPEDGRIAFTLSQSNDRIILDVANTGPLLPEAMREQLFDSLVSLRENPAQSDSKTHLGLGLHIVRLIAEFHRGRVSARNLEDGSGVAFSVSLPFGDSSR